MQVMSHVCEGFFFGGGGAEGVGLGGGGRETAAVAYRCVNLL